MSVDATVAPPRAPLIARPILGALSRHWRDGQLIVELPGRAPFGLGEPGSGTDARWRLANWRAFRRMLTRGDMGFAAGYIEGDWDSPDLAALLTGMAGNYERLKTHARGIKMLGIGQAIGHALNRNTRSGAKRNIISHYDLGNPFYEVWLDPSMTYSSALFASPGDTLETAQKQKYERLARICGIGPGSKVLEIGCGWGGFAEYAAGELGAEVHGITLSPSQKAYAEERLFKAGLADKVKLEIIDYRDVRGQYDAIASIEMFEAVGEQYWPAYFSALERNLKPGGAAGLQVITIDEALFDDYRRKPDFIQVEIFPGGMLPTKTRLGVEAGVAGLEIDAATWLGFGQDYARTLAIWRERFDAALKDVAGLGFDERFQRLWRYYLAYCEAGFRTARTDVVQFALRKPA